MSGRLIVITHKMKIIFCSLLIFSRSICHGHIIRLPCRRHGNFSISKSGVRNKDGVIKTIDNVDKARCCLHCVADDQCAYVNHKIDNSKCELLMKNDFGEDVDDNWMFVSTDYQSRNIGPFCEKAQPCPSTDFCYDTCEANNYVCYGLVRNRVYKQINANGNVNKLHTHPGYPDNPDSVQYMPNMLNERAGYEYGLLMQAYFVPLESGEYIFYASSSIGCELRFGTSYSDNSVIAKPTTYTAKYKWKKSSSQKAAPLSLVKGQKYYIELRAMSWHQKALIHSEVGVQLPGKTNVVLVTHEYLHHYP